jgi:hypothetical protein
VPTVSGAHRKERIVDMNHPAVRRYLQNLTAQPGNRTGGQPPTEAALEKLRAQCEKAELSAAAMRDRYISRDLVLQYMDELQRTQKRELDAMVSRVLDQLDREFGPLSKAQISEARRVLEQPCADALEMSARYIDQFRRDIMPRTEDTRAAEPAPGNMAKRDKAAAPRTDTALPVLLRERRDRAMARRLTVQNQIIKGELALREIVKLHLGKISGAYRAVVLEHSYSSVPPILAILRVRDPGADARLRLFLDDEAYSTAGRINRALDKWLRSRGTSNAE